MMTWLRIGCLLAISPLFLFMPHIVFAQCNTCASDVSFTTNPEFSGSYALASSVDVDQGNSPETFVTSAYWQIYGSAPSPSVVTTQANNLRTLPYWRRIDVVNTFMAGAGRTIPRVYSEPWASEPQLLTAPCKNLARDIGAVCMFFFSCAGGTNCTMDWANTHVEGMSGPSTLLSYGASSSGVYTSSSNAGFWERELLDARYAGLSYLLPNVYGPDLSNGSIANLASALATVNSMGVTAQVKIGLFDDTSGWNNNPDFPFAPWNNSLWTSASTLDGYNSTQINNAASIIYQNKWKAFFSQIPSQYWYEVNGHPLVYMYYGGTIPVDGSSQPVIAAIVTQIKTLFQADFGVTPYVVIDIGFSYGQATVADNQFVWNTLASPYVTNYISTYSNAGITADLAMVKWDPLGRDDNGSNAVATNYSGGYSSAGGVIKDDSYLKAALNNTTSATFLTLATWNDLGEGTGINRCYDYYVQGQWMPPDYFMNDIRHSQSQVTCVATNTPTITSTSTNSPTPTKTYTLTATMTNSATNSPTASNTATSSFTATLSPTPTYTKTATASATNSVSSTPTLALTATSSSTSTASPTSTFTKTFTPTTVNTLSSTATATVTSTRTFTATSSPTVTVTSTVTSTLTATKTATATTTSANSATFTPTKTNTATASNTFTYTPSPTLTFTFTFTPTLTLTNSVTSTATNSFTPTITSTKPPTATYTPSATSTKTFTASPTPTAPPPIVFPNPVIGGTVTIQMPLPNETHIEIEIFTLAMRKVRTIEVAQVTGSQITIELTDMTGMRLADGLYYFLVQAGTKKWVTKVLVLR